MRFWDSSALVPLFVAEDTTGSLSALLADDESVVVWWGADVECASAIARLERSGSLELAAATRAFVYLLALGKVWHVIDPVEAIRATAKRFLRVHDLRAADALQLAAAFIAAEGRPESLTVVSLDNRLAAAAQREGFDLIDREALPIS